MLNIGFGSRVLSRSQSRVNYVYYDGKFILNGLFTQFMGTRVLPLLVTFNGL